MAAFLAGTKLMSLIKGEDNADYMKTLNSPAFWLAAMAMFAILKVWLF